MFDPPLCSFPLCVRSLSAFDPSVFDPSIPRCAMSRSTVIVTCPVDEWALPGKFMERNETAAAALRAAFEHKASNFKGQDGESRMRQLLDELFISPEVDDHTVYRGYVDDVRNT